MLRKASELERFELLASDGRIGHVTDLFFDDRRWTIRYLVVNTGTWLEHRDVLVSPASVGACDWSRRVLPVALTRSQVEHSPQVDAEEPVTKEQEQRLANYYSWPLYWTAAGFTDGIIAPLPPFLPVGALQPQHRATASTLDEQHHVRSVADVRGHRIEANDGEIGRVDDFLVDLATWTIAYLIVDAGHWWAGRRVIVSPEWIFEVGWDEAKVFMDLPCESVRRSPEYNPSRPLAQAYADRLHEHYGLPHRSAEP